MAKAEIAKGTGKKAKEFRFVLRGKNGQIVATGEHYTRRAGVKKCLATYFPSFPVTDLTIK